MSQALQPFARARNPHSVDIESPLVASVRAVSREIPAGGRVVVIASDSRRLELLEAVKEARTQAGDVRVFLLPGVLFDPIEMSSIETRYQDYVEFEEFRSRMNQFDGVTVFEVGPKDRLRTMLSVGSREVAAV